MRVRIIAVGAITLFALLTTGCSYFAEFVIVNSSEKLLTVKYHVQPTETYVTIAVKAKIMTVEEFGDSTRVWREVPEHRITISPDFRSAKVILNPGEILLLVSNDIRDIKNEPLYKSGIRSLSVESSSGTIKYEGDQVFRQFVPSRTAWFPNAATLYTLSYSE
jgi:hypothetical protein